jgi:hypothetical protein
VVFVWSGKILIDFVVLKKSNGKDVVDAINRMSNKHSVPNSNILFDNDGCGGFVDGFIVGAKEFKNGGKVLYDEEAETLPNYPNLKTQCFYRSGDGVLSGDYYILEDVANMMYDEKHTLRQRLIFERKSIKKAKKDNDGKLMMNDKSSQKPYLNGESPDLMDTFMMREWFDIQNTASVQVLW